MSLTLCCFRLFNT